MPIDLQLNALVQNQVEENRKKLMIILKTVLYCAKQNIALRGHRDDSQHYDLQHNNPGNFQELLHLIRDTGNTVLADHFKNAPKNATYRSKTVQNELINISAEQIQKSIVNEVLKAKEYSLLADEASDISCKEHLSLVIRFVDKESNIREEFLGFLYCKDGTSGKELADLILKEVNRLGIDIVNCRGQGYDGAGGNMSGK